MQEQVVSLPEHGLFARWLLPDLSERATTAVLIWPGSGPTDGDGNQPGLVLNNLRDLSYAFAREGMASLRVDKRGVGLSRAALGKEQDLRFETYAQDAALWVDWLRSQASIQRVVLIGHSEGALVLTLAAKVQAVQGLIALCAPARKASAVIRSQLVGKLSTELEAQALVQLDALEQGVAAPVCPSELIPLFRPSVLPYLASWSAYDPQQEIQELSCAKLWVWGEADAQLPAEWQLLRSQQAHTTIPHMQHSLFTAREIKSSISAQLIDTLASWIQTT